MFDIIRFDDIRFDDIRFDDIRFDIIWFNIIRFNVCAEKRDGHATLKFEDAKDLTFLMHTGESGIIFKHIINKNEI